MEIPPELNKISAILRADKRELKSVIDRLASLTGKTDVLQKITAENDDLMINRLFSIGVPRESSAKEVYEALISKIEADDYQIFKALDEPNFRNSAACEHVGDIAKKIVNPPSGYFLKLSKAEEFLAKEPPQQILKCLGYDSVRTMLAHEDIFEIMSALRVVEGSDWLNEVFFKQYESLSPDDFEEREIKVKALSERWSKESARFVVKKKHNISHLKELGVVFVMPALLGISGELLRMFALMLHYLYEVPFYSDLFRLLHQDEKNFSRNFVSLLRGDVCEHLPEAKPGHSAWLVVQRYLAKDDENDWRLFFPHVNPEAIHWAKAERNLAQIGMRLNGFARDLLFWDNLGWVGDYFKDETGAPLLVSFNLVDTVMSLVKQKEMSKYLYHHQEALWNKLFAEYMGEAELERYCRDNLLKGYFEL